MTTINRPKPKRLLVMEAFQQLLEQISEVEDDAFTMAGKVLINTLLIGEDLSHDAPLLSVVEAPRPDVAMFVGADNEASKFNLTLLIQGIALDDRSDTTHDVYYLCQDAERRLNRIGMVRGETGKAKYPESYMLGGKITSVEIGPSVIRPPEQRVSRFSFFYIPVRIGMAGQIGD